MIYNLSTQYYKGIPIRLADDTLQPDGSRRFYLGKPKYKQTVRIPIVYLHEDGTIKKDADCDYIFVQAYHNKKLEAAHIGINPEYWRVGQNAVIDHYMPMLNPSQCLHCDYNKTNYPDNIPAPCRTCGALRTRNDLPITCIPVYAEDMTADKIRIELVHFQSVIDHYDPCCCVPLSELKQQYKILIETLRKKL